jgi:GNAT superfamily N-acetyltransferase
MIDHLLKATAANHRAWFRRGAERVERIGGLDVIVADGHGTIAFPRTRSRAAIDAAVGLGLRSMSCWSLADDDVLGARLVARGFEWGWQPHWMALELAELPEAEPGYDVVPARTADPSDLPYGSSGATPRPAQRLVVIEDGRTVGGVTVNPWRGYAGIYDMGVVRDRRRRGIGRALTIAAAGTARALGCSHALLNATAEGELLYRTVGFDSLGLGRTWWLHPGRLQ